jgi:hypothetical protein
MKPLVAVCLAMFAAAPAAAQDEALDPLLFVRSAADAGVPASLSGARTFQLYRLPLDYTLQPMDAHRWGISLTCPVSLSGVRVERTTTARTFVHSLGVFAIVPGVAFDIPLAARVRLHPFVEAGIGRGSDRHKTEVLYGAGASVRVDRRAGSVLLTAGGSAARRRAATDTGSYEAHSTFEGGADAQVPLGLAIGRRVIRGGGYAIARAFDGLAITRPGLEPVSLGHQFEAGGSLSTAPELRVWKITLPWVAVGYQFGPLLKGVRIYTSFPF